MPKPARPLRRSLRSTKGFLSRYVNDCDRTVLGWPALWVASLFKRLSLNHVDHQIVRRLRRWSGVRLDRVDEYVSLSPITACS